MPFAPATLDSFPRTWTAEVLNTPPLIAPARQVIWPQQVPGEEDTLARGALLLNVRPATGSAFLATCALGFKDPSLPSGVFSCPHADSLLAVAGGYAYLADTLAPDRCEHLPLRPVAAVFAIAPCAEEPRGLLLLTGFHTVLALDATGVRWETARLSYEGLTLTDVRDNQLHGTGWNMMTNRDVPFTVDLVTGAHTGGGFQR